MTHVMIHVMTHVMIHVVTHAMTHVMNSFVHPRQGSPARRLLHRLESSDSNHLQIPLAVIQARQPARKPVQAQRDDSLTRQNEIESDHYH